MGIKTKRAWLRIVEAFFAILLIFGAFFLIIENKKEKTEVYTGEYIEDLQRTILNNLANDEEARIKILVERNESYLNERIKTLLPPAIEFKIVLCNITDKFCLFPGEYPDKNVYSMDRVISSTLENYDPVFLRLFVWEKT